MVDPQIWRNEKFGSLPDAGRLLFIGIFSQADDDGRLKASPKFLKATIFPYDEDKTAEQVKKLRDQCADQGLIRVYTNGEVEYLDIPGWSEHQQIRKDRYNSSSLPSFDEADNQVATTGRPTVTQPTTNGIPNIVKSSIVKSSTDTPKGARKKRAEPIVNEIFADMRTYLGFPDKVKEDPIPSYGKEGQAIKRMLARGFTREEVTGCWKQKVDVRGGEFVSMTWVNEDIGKKGEKAGGKGGRVKGTRPAEDFRGRDW